MIIYSDGGARGNPGPAAIGVYIPEVEKKYSKTLGEKTNNEAEYAGVIFALKKTKALLGGNKAKKTSIEMRCDSELIVNQINGVYKIMEERLKLLFVDVFNARQDFKKVTFTHIFREENTIADELVNEALDLVQSELF